MKKIILFTILIVSYLSAFSQKIPSSIFSVTQSGNNLIVTFNLPSYTVKDTSAYNPYGVSEVFKYIDIDYFGNIDDIGYPQLPQLTVDLAVPESASDFQVTTSNEVTQDLTINKRFIPTLEDYEIEPNFQINDSYYSSNGDTYNFLSQISEPYLVFGAMGISFSIFPFTYNPQLNKITVLKQATFTISYTTTTTKSTQNDYSSPIKNSYLSGFFENYSATPLKSGTDFSGRYLMITDPVYENTLTYFANYKRNLGYDVTLVNTNTSGTSSSEIKNYIKTQYDNSSTRPDFVLLVGDHGDIPASGGNSSGGDIDDPITDLEYARLSGTYWTIRGRKDDYYADVLIGRFPISSNAELHNIINKSIYMEMNIHLFDKKAKFLAGKEDNGWMENQFENGHKKVIKKTFEPEGFSCEKLYQPTTTEAIDALSDNPLFYIYSGHGSFTTMSGGSFSIANSNIISATNTVFPFVFSFACKTGNFAYSNTCIGEHWIRANNRGGITYFGSSVSTMVNSDKAIEKKIFGDAFTDNEHIAGITILGMRRYCKRFWSFWNRKRTKRYMKAYNLLGDPSLNVLGTGCISNFMFSNDEVFNSGDEITYRAGNCVQNNNTFEVLNGSFVNLIAGDNIILKPGFRAESGSEFHAYIAPCEESVNKSIQTKSVSTFENSVPETISIEEIPEIEEFSIYPNPFNNNVKLNYFLEDDTKVQIVIYNISGNIVYEKFIKKNKGNITEDINTANLSQGTYIYKIQAGNKLYRGKIVKVE
ncbi:MAG: T9SS type A sorting domain-containing protein [bacterium]|nr:T9SS type A sorting domain-containing protein [bacterium]